MEVSKNDMVMLSRVVTVLDLDETDSLLPNRLSGGIHIVLILARLVCRSDLEKCQSSNVVTDMLSSTWHRR